VLQVFLVIFSFDAWLNKQKSRLLWVFLAVFLLFCHFQGINCYNFEIMNKCGFIGEYYHLNVFNWL